MEAYEQITLDQWVQWKEDIRQKLAETVANFVHIGYRLRQIRDSGMFDGAADIFKFAEREYGLGKSTVSRFIAINEKYSEGGNSLELKKEFRGYSQSMLTEMLTLPDNEIQLVTERTTVREIRELKEFNRQEVPETEECGQEPPGTASRDGEAPEGRGPLRKCLTDFFRDKEEMLNGIVGSLGAEPPGYREAMERMNPSGQASHKKGIVFLFLYDWTTGARYKLLTRPEPVSLTWTELLDEIFDIYGSCDRKNVWGDFYGGTDGETSVAMSQRDPDGGKTPGTPGEYVAAALEEPPEAGKGQPEAVKDDMAAAVRETVDPPETGQLPGQMEVYDYPELIPGETGEGNHGTEGKEAGEPSHADGGMDTATGGGQEPDPPQHDEVPGTAEDDGCEEDPGDADVRMTEDAAWEEVREAIGEIRGRTVIHWGLERGIGTDQVRDLYKKAISLAAALEKIMMIRSKKP